MTPRERQTEAPLGFTVFTPTYNRAHTLARVYDSLCRQTFRSFEWLVIDDGSTDDTGSLVARWIEEGAVEIRYLSQPNRGKHLAHNRAIEEARGELFLPLDSDDACVPEALDRLWYWWNSIPDDLRPMFSGVGVVTQDTDGRLIGDPYPASPWDGDPRELVYRYRIRGEKWGCTRTEILRQYPFPTIEGTAFVPEGIVWFAVARRFKMRHVNEALRIYYRDVPSLTRATQPSRSAAGKRLAYRDFLDEDIEFYWRAPMTLSAFASQYGRYGWHAGVSARQQLRALKHQRARVLFLLAAPVGAALYLFDRFRAWRAS